MNIDKAGISNKILIGFSFLCMAVFGFLSSTQGVVLPVIKQQFNISFTTVGLILFFSSIGYLFATFSGGFLLRRFGYKKIMIIAFTILISTSILFFISKVFFLIIIGFFLMGFSFGFFEVAVNSLVVSLIIKNTVILMNFTHLFYGVGASIGPIYASKVVNSSFDWSMIYVFFSALLIGAIFFIFIIKFPKIKNDKNDNSIFNFSIFKDKVIWLFSIMLGLTLAVEMSISSWLVNYLTFSRNLTTKESSLYITLFFVFFTFGRLVSGFIAKKVGHFTIVIWYFIGSTITILVASLLGNSFIFLFSISGFFISVFFPVIMVIIAEKYPKSITSILGSIITFAGIIGMVLVFFIGKVNDLFGVLYSMPVIVIYSIIGLGLTIYISKMKEMAKTNEGY